jgi:hypothetical protein
LKPGAKTNVTEQFQFDGDRLRSLDHVHEPDPRNVFFAIWNDESAQFSPITIKNQHDEVASITLNAGVPEDVVAQLETTKNLYLYAWFVYRFYPVAQHHALTCLELALRTRFWQDIRANRVPCRGKTPMLKELLHYAIGAGVVVNQGFAAWHDVVWNRARYRVEQERFRKMQEEKIESMVWDESSVQVKEEDQQVDYLGILLDTIPQIRNSYAHGSSNLHNQGLHTIQIVAEIINQLFPLSPE